MHETIAELKKQILTLAASGKLVPQDPKEGTGEDLYAEIQGERVQAEKSSTGRKKKTKELPPLTTEEIPFNIPTSWKWVRLGDCMDISSGDMIRTTQATNGEYPIYGGNGIAGRHSSFNVREGTIIIGRVGAQCGSVHVTETDAWVSDNAFIVRYPQKLLHGDYFAQTLRYLDLRKSHRGAAQPVISGISVYPILMPLPPLSEQKRIVAKVEEVMAELDVLEKECSSAEELLTQLERSLLTLAVSGKLVPQDPKEGTGEDLYAEIQKERAKVEKNATGRKKKAKELPSVASDELPFDIPASWKWVRLGQVTNYGYAEKCKPKDIHEGTWVLELEDMERDGGNLLSVVRYPERKSLSDKNVFFAGDVLYGKLRPYLNKVLYADEGGIASSELLPLRFWGKGNGAYLRMVLLSEYFSEHVNQRTYGMKMPRLGTDDGKKSPIPLPPLVEQKRIVAKVDEVMALVKQLREVVGGK